MGGWWVGHSEIIFKQKKKKKPRHKRKYHAAIDVEKSWQSSEIQGCNIEFYTLQSSLSDFKPTMKSHRSKK